MKSIFLFVVLLSTVFHVSRAMRISDVINENNSIVNDVREAEIVTPQCSDFLMPCVVDTNCCGDSECVKRGEFEEAMCLPPQ